MKRIFAAIGFAVTCMFVICSLVSYNQIRFNLSSWGFRYDPRVIEPRLYPQYHPGYNEGVPDFRPYEQPVQPEQEGFLRETAPAVQPQRRIVRVSSAR